jgi:hypothetical protein
MVLFLEYYTLIDRIPLILLLAWKQEEISD